jgi:hypothetical protein
MAVELDLIATISRTDLPEPLGLLDLNDGVNFTVSRNVRVGSVTWRREIATSPYVAGRIPIQEVKDAAESSVGIYVAGTTAAELHANLATLLAAFTEQYTYQLRINVDGIDNQWRCERADYEVGFVTEMLAAKYLPVMFSFHRHPTPVQGAF